MLRLPAILAIAFGLASSTIAAQTVSDFDKACSLGDKSGCDSYAQLK